MSVLLATLFLVLVGGVVSSVVYLYWKIDQLTVVSNTGGTGVLSGPVAIMRRYDHANLVVTTEVSFTQPTPTVIPDNANFYPLVFAANPPPVFVQGNSNSNIAKFSLAEMGDSSNNRIIYTPDFASIEGGTQISLNCSTTCQVHIIGTSPLELHVGIGISEDTVSLSPVGPICFSTVYYNTGLPIDTNFNFTVSCVFLADTNLFSGGPFAIFPIIRSDQAGSQFSTRSILLSVQETPILVKSF